MIPRSRSARSWSAGAVLILVPFISVTAYRGRQRPWIASAPAYRQEGPAAAKITLVEFSDFQCPACSRAVMPLKQIRALYGPNLRVIFKHFPWKFHKWALPAAVAAECAGRQGKFWEMHDLLYLKQDEWGETADGDARIDSYARSIPMDRKAYELCAKDPATAAAIDSDQQEGTDHWVHSTPTFFINGKRFVGAVQLRTDGVREIERLIVVK